MFNRVSFIFIICLLVCSANAQVRQKQADYCKSVISPEYDEKVIKTTAVLYFPPEGDTLNEPNHASVFFYDNRCNNKDHFAMAAFSQTKDRDFVENLVAANSKTRQPTFVQVEFEGKLSMAFIPSFGQYAWLRAEIAVKKVNSANVVEYSLPDFEAEAPLIETGNFMKWFNADFMFSFYGNGLSQSELADLLTNDSIIFISKRKYNKEEFLEYIQTKQRFASSVRMTSVTKNENIWRIQGEFTQEFEDKPKRVRKYDNKYLVENTKSVRLIYSKLE